MTPVFETDGVLPIDTQTARCIATGTVDSIGLEALAAIGITTADPDGPANDPYADLSRQQIDWVVAVWSGCTDVPTLVERALLSGGPQDLDPSINECLTFGLSQGLAEAFLAEALADEAEPGGAFSDVLRVVDGCTIGAERGELESVDPRLWPWLTVTLPEYELDVVSRAEAAELGLADALQGGPGVHIEALDVSDQDGELAAVLIVAAIDEAESGTVTADNYAANIVASAGDTEVFPFTLPGGVDAIGWEEVDSGVVYMVWAGRRIVVFATGPVTAADVLSVYAELVPAP